MAWQEIFKNELYKNGNGCFLKKDTNGENANGEFVIFDQDNQTNRIPICDILENPVYKYTSAWHELKTLIDSISGNSGALYFSVIAKEPISAFSPVSLAGRKANSNMFSLIDGTCQGVSIIDVSIDTVGQFQTTGIIQNLSWTWTENQPVYLNGNTLSQVIPTTGLFQKIGIAKNATTLILKISDVIRL